VRVLPIRYCADMEASARFYAALGLELGAATRPGGWRELPAAAGLLALHRAAAGEAGACELAFEADEPLEAVRDRLVAAGFAPEPIMDESYGRSLRVADPDGVAVQVNENDRSLYT
jgi:catechol 2,3-dioxygenase-like lactoylglutathione lyase family enzyme